METGISSCIVDKKWGDIDEHVAGADESFFAACAEHGIRRVELSVMEGYIAPGDWAAVERMRVWADKYGVTIHSVHGPSGYPTNGHWLGDPDEGVRKRNVRERLLALEGARRMGAQYMVVEFEAYDQWPFWPHGQKPGQVFPQAEKQWRRSFDELLPEADRAGVALAVENVDGVPNQALPSLMAGLSRKQAGICFDSSHATYGGDFFAQLAMLAPYIIGTHLSDNDGLPGSQWDDRHWKPFQGGIDWPRLVREISAKSPCPCLILEVLDREKISPAFLETYRKIAALAN